MDMQFKQRIEEASKVLGKLIETKIGEAERIVELEIDTALDDILGIAEFVKKAKKSEKMKQRISTKMAETCEALEELLDAYDYKMQGPIERIMDNALDDILFVAAVVKAKRNEEMK